MVDTEEEERPQKGRSLRRGTDRAAERKRKLEEEKDRKEKAEMAAKESKSKGSKQYQKVLKRIEDEKAKIQECEDEVATLDGDLREADCPRLRVLGKDRFWNRYYWMERNAMPYAGLPNSSTSNAGYANGRLWVQGPDDIERQGFLEIAPAEQRIYKHHFRVTVLERKSVEEGPTNVFTAHQWGYFEDPEAIDDLIGWLDTRGNREVKLRKELVAQQEYIKQHMTKRQEYLNPSEEAEKAPEPTTRTSTRSKVQVEESPRYRCTKWHNSTAMLELGHLHSEPPAKGTKKGKKGVANVVVDEGVSTRAKNRQGKPLTRQGTRYAF